MLGIHATAHSDELRGLTRPEVVHDGDGALELLTDLHIDVLVEAGAQRTE